LRDGDRTDDEQQQRNQRKRPPSHGVDSNAL
jgi:hypothetical protein